MRMFVDAISYMLKSLPIFLLAAILPSALISLAGNPFEPIIFIHEYARLNISSTEVMFEKLFSTNGWYFMILAAIANIVGVSLLFGVMERHLKSGRYGMMNPLRRINDSMIAVIPLLIVFYVLLLLIYYALGGSLSLLHYLMSGFGNVPTVPNLIIAISLIVVFYIIAVGFMSYTVFLIPSYLIMGYPLSDSVSFAFRMHNGNGAKLFLSWLICTAIVYAITMLSSMLKLPSYVYATIDVAFVMMFYASLSMTAFFKSTGLERRDNDYN